MTLRNSIVPLVAACFVAAMAMSAASAPLAARPARVSPSFDCAKAATKVEKTICGSPSLSRADADVATLYRQRRHELNPAAAALLANDQRYLLSSRERIFGYGYTDSAELLGDVLAGRADFLRRLTVPSGEGLAGRWDNVTGGLTIALVPGGKLEVQINTNEPVTARWVCDIQSIGRPVGGVLEITSEEDGSTLRLTRIGQTLKVQAEAPAGKATWTPGYCGLNGSVDGDYFSMKPRPGKG